MVFAYGSKFSREIDQKQEQPATPTMGTMYMRPLGQWIYKVTPTITNHQQQKNKISVQELFKLQHQGLPKSQLQDYMQGPNLILKELKMNFYLQTP